MNEPQVVALSSNREIDTFSHSSAADLVIAGLLAFLAGLTDVYGVERLHDLYVSFMSGNTTMLGLALGTGDWKRAELIAIIVGFFVGGAAFGAILEVLATRHHDAWVVGFVAVALLLPLDHASLAVPVFTTTMGALNAAIARVGPAAVSLTFVTGTLVKFGQGLGRALCGRPESWAWALQLPMWFALLAGATAGVQVQAKFGTETFWPLSAIAGFILLAILIRHVVQARS